jgi:hypothetical protein
MKELFSVPELLTLDGRSVTGANAQTMFDEGTPGGCGSGCSSGCYSGADACGPDWCKKPPLED